MDLKTMVRGVVHVTAEDVKAFAAARPGYVALARYATIAEIVGAIDADSVRPYARRSEIALALSALHHEQPRAVWQTLVLRAYGPMLVALAASLRGVDRDVAEADVVAAFLETLATVRLHGPAAAVAFRLTKEVRRRVFRALRADRARARSNVRDEDVASELSVDPFGGDEDVRLAKDAVARIAPSPELLDVLIATVANGEPLGEFLARRYPGQSPDERAATYGRVQRMRHRALARLRAEAAALAA